MGAPPTCLPACTPLAVEAPTANRQPLGPPRGPHLTRPARPLRCCAAALLMKPSSSLRMPRSTSCCISLERPVSTTTVTSSMVMEVSATLVASTILVTPAGGLPGGGGREGSGVGETRAERGARVGCGYGEGGWGEGGRGRGGRTCATSHTRQYAPTGRHAPCDCLPACLPAAHTAQLSAARRTW